MTDESRADDGDSACSRMCFVMSMFAAMFASCFVRVCVKL